MDKAGILLRPTGRSHGASCSDERKPGRFGELSICVEAFEYAVHVDAALDLDVSMPALAVSDASSVARALETWCEVAILGALDLVPGKTSVARGDQDGHSSGSLVLCTPGNAGAKLKDLPVGLRTLTAIGDTFDRDGLRQLLLTTNELADGDPGLLAGAVDAMATVLLLDIWKQY